MYLTTYEILIGLLIFATGFLLICGTAVIIIAWLARLVREMAAHLLAHEQIQRAANIVARLDNDGAKSAFAHQLLNRKWPTTAGPPPEQEHEESSDPIPSEGLVVNTRL